MVTMDDVLVRPVGPRVRRPHRRLRRGRHVRRPAARRLPTTGGAAALEGRPARPGTPTIKPWFYRDIWPILFRARPVQLSLQHPRAVELPARPAAARHLRSGQTLQSCPKYVATRRPTAAAERAGLPKPTLDARWRRNRDRRRSAACTTRKAARSTIRTGRCGSYLFGLLRLPARRTSSRSRTRSAAGCTTCR